MKLIGRTINGGVIVEGELSEYLNLLAAGHFMANLPAVEIYWQGAAAQPDRPVAEPKRTYRRTATTPAPKEGKRICLSCKKPLDKSYSPIAKTHKGKCKTAYARDYARRHYQELHPKDKSKQPAAAVPEARSTLNPSDVTLSDKEREAARLELIRRSAERCAGN